MKRKNIAVLFGGCSTEYEISLQSAYAVISNIDKEKYESVLIGITRQGEWFKYTGDIENIINDTWYTDVKHCTRAIISPDRSVHGLIEFIELENETKIKITELDAVFPVLHGKNGEDGTVQGLAELSGIRVIGCGLLSSALCMDKDRAHKLVSLEGIKIPRGEVITKEIAELAGEGIFFKTQELKYPLFVKPVKAGSSFGISKVYCKEELMFAVKKAFTHDDEVIIEENIEGFEVGCAILGNEKLVIGEVDEIELSKGFFDYNEKYFDGTSKIHMPARIDRTKSDEIKNIASICYRVLGCKGFARVDMFLTPEGDVVFNEVNTIPGFTTHSRYPNMMKGIGMSFKDIIEKLIEEDF